MFFGGCFFVCLFVFKALWIYWLSSGLQCSAEKSGHNLTLHIWWFQDLATFKIFSLVFDFKNFNYNVLWYGSLWVYLTWSLLSFLNVYVFHWIWGVLAIAFKNILSLLFIRLTYVSLLYGVPQVPLEKEIATRPSILAWEIPSTKKPDRLYSPWDRKESETTEQFTLQVL